MKHLKLLVILLAFFAKPELSKADVIYYPLHNAEFALSYELIGSYELTFSRFNSLNIWAGIGGVSVFNEIRYPAWGSEVALELRQYFSKNSFKRFNCGLYLGIARMKEPEVFGSTVYIKSVGIVPGFKFTYKLKPNNWFAAEPYIGISNPLYGKNFKAISSSEPVITMGIRVGLNLVKSRKNE